MAQKEDDFQKIKKLIKIMKENDLVEVELKHDDDKILLKRAQPPQHIAVPMAAAPAAGGDTHVAPQAQASVGEERIDDGLVDITSPIVGTFYATPSPDSDPFVEAGSSVSPQTIVCVIEAMKVMNEIKAETTGKIEQVMVKSGQAVEFGEVLFRVRPE